MRGLVPLFFAALIVLLATVIGIISAFIALVRGKKFLPFTLLGMILNVGPLVLLSISLSH